MGQLPPDEPPTGFETCSKRGDLVHSLDSDNFDDGYEITNPAATNRYSFRSSIVSSDYAAWPTMAELADVDPSLGILENRRGALVSIDRVTLEQRMRMYYDKGVSWESLVATGSGLSKDAARFDARNARTKAITVEGFEEQSIRRLMVRPMDQRWCYYTRVRPIWNEPRTSYVDQCWEGNAALVSRRQGVADPEGTPFFFTSAVGAQHALSTDAYYVPLRLRPGITARPGKAKQEALFAPDMVLGEAETANLSPAARAYLVGLGIFEPDADADTADLIWMHALAMGYSPAYLVENADGLRQDWPRIPLPTAKDALLASAALGRQVAALLDSDTPVPGVTAGGIRPELREIARVTSTSGRPLDPDAGDLALTVGWGHAGKAGVIMPGRGRLLPRPYTPEEETAIRHGAADLGVAADDAFATLGAATSDVYLNDHAYWRNVPTEVWSFTIGGYQVMKKWLSYREQSLLGRPLTAAEATEVRDMARRLAALRLLQPALDANYRAVIAATYPWPAATPEHRSDP